MTWGSPTTLTGKNIALQETPEDKKNKKRKVPEDCHVLIPWSALKAVVTENMQSFASQ
jgi:hypothetical protein